VTEQNIEQLKVANADATDEASIGGVTGTRSGDVDTEQSEGLDTTGMPYAGGPAGGAPLGDGGLGGDGRGMPGQETGV
jgi:hypothetical protein